jgi:hypothetical protein
VTATLCRKLRETETGPGGEVVSRGHMPRHITSFPPLVVVWASRPSSQSFVIIPAAPRRIHRPHPVPAASGVPAAVCSTVSRPDPHMIVGSIAYVTSVLSVLLSYTPLPTSWTHAR